MTLREAKQAVRAFIRTWSDQRLAEVYAFNADGKMCYRDACGCLLGVTGADQVHGWGWMGCDGSHYQSARELPGANNAERGYLMLCGVDGHRSTPEKLGERDALRRARLSAILRAEMRHRSTTSAGRPTVYTKWVTSQANNQGTR